MTFHMLQADDEAFDIYEYNKIWYIATAVSFRCLFNVDTNG